MFAAVLSRGSAPLSLTADELLSVVRRSHPGDVSGAVHREQFLACQSLLWATPESRRESVPLVDAGSGRVLVSWLRLDNRADLAAALGWDHKRGTDATDPDYVLAAFQRWGTGCADRLEGDFSFVLWDPGERSVYAARDASGIKPLYYAEAGAVLACATSPVPLVALAGDGVDVSVSSEWIARFIHRVSMDWSSTPFRGIRKVPPGHWLQATPTGVNLVRYHEFVDDAPWETDRLDDWLEAYRDRLTEAVSARVRSDAPIGVETSGGVDSSTILAFIATVHPEHRASMHTFGFVHEPLEPEYLLETSRVLGISNNHVLVPDLGQDEDSRHDRMRRGWECLGHPVEHENAIGHIPFYEMARHFGVRTLHSGHGGDEVVTNSGGLAARELLLRAEYAALWRDRAGPAWRRTLSIAKARVLRDRPRLSRLAVVQDRLAWSPLKSEVLESSDVISRTAKGAAYDSCYDSVNGFILGNRWAPFVSTRTSECSIVAASYGVDYRWALLDRRLIQQYLSTPSVWKYGEGTGRYLHRRAISGIVPDKVAWKPGKSMAGPDGFHEPAATPASRLPVDALHPQVADLVDAARWHRSAADAPWVSRRALSRCLEISEWLNEP